jgi:hypothetical protein
MGNSASVSAWSSTYTEIKTQHDAAYAVIQNAITLEEEEKPNEVEIQLHNMFYTHIFCRP